MQDALFMVNSYYAFNLKYKTYQGNQFGEESDYPQVSDSPNNPRESCESMDGGIVPEGARDHIAFGQRPEDLTPEEGAPIYLLVIYKKILNAIF